MLALGEDICENMGKDAPMVCQLFTNLAARTDSQYSYKNAIVAIDTDGTPMGASVGYDGALLSQLREAFFEESERISGRSFRDIPDETDSAEYYLDTLAVLPEHRGRGVATALIKSMNQKAANAGKPLGLLVDKENLRARKLYEYVGFKKVGERYFMHEMMDHLLLPSENK